MSGRALPWSNLPTSPNPSVTDYERVKRGLPEPDHIEGRQLYLREIAARAGLDADVVEAILLSDPKTFKMGFALTADGASVPDRNPRTPAHRVWSRRR
jgi:hypothetical protein